MTGFQGGNRPREGLKCQVLLGTHGLTPIILIYVILVNYLYLYLFPCFQASSRRSITGVAGDGFSTSSGGQVAMGLPSIL
jgi:hypothetical protein